MSVSCNDPAHEARRREERARAAFERAGRLGHELADALYGTPCLVCGAPIDRNGDGHDPGCMVRP